MTTNLNPITEEFKTNLENVIKIYESMYRDEQVLHPALSLEEREKLAYERTRRHFIREYVPLQMSNAVDFEGIIIGASSPIDAIKTRKNEALEMWQANPVVAIQNKLTNEQGQPLDKFGRLLPEKRFIFNVIGICKKSNTVTPQKFSLTMTTEDETSIRNIPFFKAVKFKAILRKEENNVLWLGGSKFTEFNIVDNNELPIEKMLLTYFNQHRKELFSLNSVEFKQQTDGKKGFDFNRFAIIEGSVYRLRMQVSEKTKNKMIQIIDEANWDYTNKLPPPTITCWIPEHVMIDFAEDSRVIIIGQLNQRNYEYNGEQRSEIQMNAFSVWCDPKYKIPMKEIKELTDKDMSYNPSEEGKGW